MKKKQGFTLIELLAVIVILAVIALIATPIIMDIINDAKIGSFKDSILNVEHGTELYRVRKFNEEEINEFQFTNGTMSPDVEIKGNMNHWNGRILYNNKNQVSIAIWNGSYCALKRYQDKDVLIDKAIKTAKDCKIDGENNGASEINRPVYQINPAGEVKAKEKIVTIIYPILQETSYVNEYSIDNGVTWTRVEGNQKELKLYRTTNVMARVRDSKNDKNTVNAKTIQVENFYDIYINLDDIPTNFYALDSYDLPTDYNYAADTGIKSCVVNGIELTNTKTLLPGNHTIQCTIKNSYGETKSVSKTIHLDQHIYHEGKEYIPFTTYISDGYTGVNRREKDHLFIGSVTGTEAHTGFKIDEFDFTNVKKIAIEYEHMSTNDNINNGGLKVYVQVGTQVNGFVMGPTNLLGRRTLELDTTNITGNNLFSVQLATSGPVTDVKVYDIQFIY